MSDSDSSETDQRYTEAINEVKENVKRRHRNLLEERELSINGEVDYSDIRSKPEEDSI